MLEPVTYAEKRAALNEILLQQMVGILLRIADPVTKQNIQQMVQQYGIGQQTLRNVEAERILGPVEHQSGVLYATSQTIFKYLEANLGRTYFGIAAPTPAPDGSIGTPGFHLKFKEWVQSLPDYDVVLNPEMQSGFYRDANVGNIPILVIRKGNELILACYKDYASVMTLNLDHIPSGYRWSNNTHYALRGELFGYRNDLTITALEEELRTILTAHGIDTLHVPTDVGSVIVVSDHPTFDGSTVDERFENAMKQLADPNISPEDRNAIIALVGDAIDNDLANDPNEEVYAKKVRLTEAQFGAVDTLSFESWMAEHYEAFKDEVAARYAGRHELVNAEAGPAFVTDAQPDETGIPASAD